MRTNLSKINKKLLQLLRARKVNITTKNAKKNHNKICQFNFCQPLFNLREIWSHVLAICRTNLSRIHKKLSKVLCPHVLKGWLKICLESIAVYKGTEKDKTWDNKRLQQIWLRAKNKLPNVQMYGYQQNHGDLQIMSNNVLDNMYADAWIYDLQTTNLKRKIRIISNLSMSCHFPPNTGIKIQTLADLRPIILPHLHTYRYTILNLYKWTGHRAEIGQPPQILALQVI